jgi:hypothetical protein
MFLITIFLGRRMVFEQEGVSFIKFDNYNEKLKKIKLITIIEVKVKLIIHSYLIMTMINKLLGA